MRSYDTLYRVWSESVPTPPDPQLVLQCREQVYVPLGKVLPQYKWLVRACKGGQDYYCLKEYLASAFGNQVVESLEAMDAGN